MKNVKIFSLICCTFFTQCHTSTIYLMKDYNPSSNNRLDKIILFDSTEYHFNNRSLYRFENDSILIVPSLKLHMSNALLSNHAAYDTLKIKNIHSIFVSELNTGLTILAATIGAGSILYSVAWLMVSMTR